MSRYTGPSWKISRRLKYSTLESGKELRKRAYPRGSTAQDAPNYPNTRCSCRKSKKCASPTG